MQFRRALNIYRKYSFRIYVVWIFLGVTTTVFTYLTSEEDCLTLKIPNIDSGSQKIDSRTVANVTICSTSYDCGSNQQCIQNECVCSSGYITVTTFCGYKQSSQLVVFLLSFFVGGLGVDWFYLARGNACYNCAGAGKLLSCGGLGFWWLVDWIIILASGRNDGNGQPLNMNLT